jgi:hypothetical protein
LRHLEQSQNLTRLIVDASDNAAAITDEALRHLGRMKQLEHLSVRGVFTDAGVDQLRDLRGLRTLALQSPIITNGALEALSKHAGLRELHLRGQFGDAGMVHLQPLVHLESFSCAVSLARGRIAAELRRPTQIDFVDVRLVDLSTYLYEFHKIPLCFDPQTMADADSWRAYRLTGEAKNQSLRDALDQLLGPTPFGWKLTDGAIVLTTKEAADRSRANTLALQRKLNNLKQFEVEW